MHKIEFYFDPSCPFSWITSRWVKIVEANRKIDITWRPFSLAIKNNELEKSDGDQYTEAHRASHRILRLMHSATIDHHLSMDEIYSFAGYLHHVEKKPLDEVMIEQLIVKYGLTSDLAQQADNPDYDESLEQIIKDATNVVGEDVGVPIIVFRDEQESDQGYFGPVLQSLPSLEDSLQIWDGLSQLATTSSFYELKRTRPSGAPDVDSTR